MSASIDRTQLATKDDWARAVRHIKIAIVLAVLSQFVVILGVAWILSL